MSESGVDVGHISIREAAQLTGLTPATLRAWEARYAFPRPLRLAGGHRRYSAEEIGLLRRVQQQHGEGLTLSAAVEQVLSGAVRPASLYASMRETLPDAVPQTLPKPVLIAMSHALEDECAWRAESPILVGGFQHRRFYELEQERWRDLAASAAGAFVLAEGLSSPDTTEEPSAVPAFVPLRPGDLARREWFVVCRSASFCAALVGWERPRRRDRPRLFEVLWTLDPRAVSRAVDTVVNLARTRAPMVAAGLERVNSPASPSAAPDAATTVALSRRIVEYVAARV